MNRPLEIVMPIKVQTYDIDFAGIVSNIAYIRWLEDLRVEFLRIYYPLDQMIPEGIAPILLSTEIHYKRPVRLLDQVEGHLKVHALKAMRWILDAEIKTHGEIAATAQQSGCFINLQTGRPIPLPEELMGPYREIAKRAEST